MEGRHGVLFSFGGAGFRQGLTARRSVSPIILYREHSGRGSKGGCSGHAGEGERIGALVQPPPGNRTIPGPDGGLRPGSYPVPPLLFQPESVLPPRPGTRRVGLSQRGLAGQHARPNPPVYRPRRLHVPLPACGPVPRLFLPPPGPLLLQPRGIVCRLARPAARPSRLVRLPHAPDRPARGGPAAGVGPALRRGLPVVFPVRRGGSVRPWARPPAVG